MAQTIKLKRSNTSGTKPTTSSLALGEIALNTKDGLFFLRRHVDGTNGNDTIRAYTPEYLTEYDSQIDVTVTVDTKTAAHPQYGNGSSNGFLLDGLEGPFLVLIPGNTYRFDQSDSSNSSHPLRFYYESDKTTSYTTGVTTNGTAGSSGAYTEIAVTTSTPSVLYYQCSSHSLMGSGAYCGGGTIVEDQLAANSVTSAKIAANAVGSSEIAANAITSSELAANSITSTHITSGVVIEADVADNAVTSAKIAANAVGSSEIAANAVGTSEIASNSITSALISANQVGISELNVTDGTSGQALTTNGSGTLSFSDVSSTLSGATDSNISSPSGGQVLVYDGTNSWDNVSISGDATLSSAGALTIAANAIEASMIAANAVGASEIAANSVGISELNVTDGTSGQVLTTDGSGTLSFSTVSGGGSQNLFSTIAVSGQSDIVADATTDTLTFVAGSNVTLTTNASNDSITIAASGASLADNAVTAAKIAANAVGSSEIAANAVGATQLAASGVSAGTYGSATASPQITVDADGRITSVSNTTISASSGNGYGFTQSVDLDEATGDGSTTSFNTGNTILSENNTIVFVDGVYQEKGTYSVSGSNVVFSSAPPSGVSIEIMHLHQVTTGGGFAHNEFNGDGSTTGFTLSTTPSAETDLIVFIDGVYQNRDSFTISGTTLTFDTAPANSTKIIAYTISGVITGKSNITNTFNGDNSTTDFTLTLNPNDENNTNVYVGGVYQPKSTYSVSGTTLSFSEAPPSGTGNIEVIISQITTTTQLADNSVTSAAIAANAIGASEIAANAVGSAEIAANAVGSSELAGNSVGATQIAANSVGTSELDMANITFSTLDVATTTTDDSVTITTTEDSSAAAPVITLKRNSASPADADYLGQIKFKGENDADQEVVYAKITGKIDDNTDTTEDGIIEFANIKDGTQTITVRLKSNEMQLLNSTGLNVAGTTVLSGLTYPTSDGTNGQVLQTNGGGTLSFGTISSYTNSDVESYLDGGTSTPTFSNTTISGNLSVDGGTIKLDGNYPTGTGNVALGNTALDSLTSGAYNVAIGGTALTATTSGSNNNGVGYGALAALTDGTHNNAFGTLALDANTSGNYNNGFGTNALGVNTTGNSNNAFGYNCLDANTTGSSNAAFGHGALGSNTTASNNTALGYLSLFANTTGTPNTAVGSGALQNNTTGGSNVAVGQGAVGDTTTGSNNTGIGTGALNKNTTAANNTAVGYNALTANTTGTQNNAFGSASLASCTTGNYNCAFGQATLNQLTTGSSNVAVGDNALQFGTTETANVAIGENALRNSTTNYNTAVGTAALDAQTSGYYNTALGYAAGGAVTSGIRSTFLGYGAGNTTTTGTNNTIIGYDALGAAAGTSSQVVIGNSARSQGGGYFTVATSTTNYTYIDIGTTAWQSSSDERLKKEITDSTAGLSFVNDLRPVTFKWKTKGEVDSSLPHYKEGSNKTVIGDSDSSTFTKHGFIAQEVKAVLDNHPEVKEGSDIWKENDEGIQNFSPSALIPMLVKSIQELSAKCDSLQSEINILKGE